MTASKHPVNRIGTRQTVFMRAGGVRILPLTFSVGDRAVGMPAKYGQIGAERKTTTKVVSATHFSGGNRGNDLSADSRQALFLVVIAQSFRQNYNVSFTRVALSNRSERDNPLARGNRRILPKFRESGEAISWILIGFRFELLFRPCSSRTRLLPAPGGGLPAG